MSNIDILNSNPDTTRESYLFTDHPSTPNGNEGTAKWHINTLFHKGVENYRSQIATLSGSENKMLYRNYNDGWSKWEEVGNGVITGDTSDSTGVNPDVEQELLEIRELILSLIEGEEGQPGLNDELQALIKRLDDLMIQADFTTISAKDAYLDRIHGGSIDIINASIDSAKINLASINTLLAGNITAENIKSGAITAQSGVIANGAILNGMIVNLDVGKLLAGNISTNKFNIVSDSGNLSMKENTLKVWDTTGQERVSLGKNGTDYNLLVRGLDGHTVLFGSDGVTKAGITEGAIDDSKVDVNANISGGKLNINSVVSHINAGITSIESTHINLDGQKLDVAFSKLGTDFSNLLTDFTVEQGKISSIITDVDNTGQTVSTMKQDLSGFSQSLTSLQETTGELSTGLATTTQDLTGFKTTVSESYYTKQEVEDKVQAGNVLYDAYILAQEELERIKFEAYKDGTITPAERQAITDALEVVRVAKEKYEESGEQVEYVGRNLVLLSDVDKFSTSNVLAEYTLSRKLIPGKYYTLTVNGFIGAGKLGYVAYLDNTNNLIGELVDVDGKNNTITFKAFSTVASVTKLIINTRGSGTSRSDIDWVKLEAGKSSTDWTVAPEDTAELITTATSSISQLSDAIDLKVSKDGVIAAINLTPGSAKIEAKKITLQGAVTVLSDITGSLGTIRAGNIYGTNIYSTNIESSTITSSNFISNYSLSDKWGSRDGTMTLNTSSLSMEDNFTSSSGDYSYYATNTKYSSTGIKHSGGRAGIGNLSFDLNIRGINWTSTPGGNNNNNYAFGIEPLEKYGDTMDMNIYNTLYNSDVVITSGGSINLNPDGDIGGVNVNGTLTVSDYTKLEGTTTAQSLYANNFYINSNRVVDYVVETGSNSNGEWTKYNSGKMICSNHFAHIVTNVANGSNNNYDFSFPQTFTNLPSVGFAGEPTSNDGGIRNAYLNCSAISGSIIRFRVFNAGSGVVENLRRASYVAVGRWK